MSHENELPLPDYDGGPRDRLRDMAKASAAETKQHTVTLSAEDWVVVRAALSTIVESISPVSPAHMAAGRVYHRIAKQTNGYTSDEAIDQLRSII